MNQDDHGRAVASLVLGIVSIVCYLFSVIGGVIGLACGIIAIILGNKVRKNGPNGLATAGFVCGIVGTVLCALMVVACTCLFGTAVNVVNSLPYSLEYY